MCTSSAYIDTKVSSKQIALSVVIRIRDNPKVVFPVQVTKSLEVASKWGYAIDYKAKSTAH